MSFSQLNNNSLHIIGYSPRVFILGNAVFQYPKLEISLKLDYTKTINIVSIYQRYKRRKIKNEIIWKGIFKRTIYK